jgi:hypothetical protein
MCLEFGTCFGYYRAEPKPMKTKFFRNGMQMMIMLTAFLILLTMQKLVAQVCTNPANVIYGLTGNAEIRPITIATGAVAGKINPNYTTGGVPDLANALGYHATSGRFYYFKRNTMNAPQEFVSYNSLTNTYSALANSPIFSVVNLGAVAANGFGYYCIDALGRLYYFRFATASWVTICTNVRDNFGTPLPNIISGGAVPTATDRIYGDLAFDGSGNMWIMISGPTDYGLYKIPAASVPTNAVASLTIHRIIPPNTPSPGLQSIGGIGFNPTGQLLFATNAGDNRLYRLNNDYSYTYLSTMTLDGVGTDLVTCSMPMFVLSTNWLDFTVKEENETAELKWTVDGSKENHGYYIEHSQDGKNWQEIGFVADKKAVKSIQTYSFTHRGLTTGKHWYRIAAIDINDRKSYSEEKMISLNNGAMISLFPNPAYNKLHVQLPAANGLNAGVTIYDHSGRQTITATLQNGTNTIDIHSLKAGTYFIRIALAGGEVINQRFIKNAL